MVRATPAISKLAQLQVDAARRVSHIEVTLPDFPDELQYASIQLNSGSVSWHADRASVGPRVATSLGSFTVGRLRFQGGGVDAFERLVVFSGWEVHFTELFEGLRLAMLRCTHG